MPKENSEVAVVVSKNGPYLVSGNIPLSEQTIGTAADGGSETWVEGKVFPPRGKYALCRCGHSRTKPFCDGTHGKIAFDGTETASRQPYLERAQLSNGPTMALTDVEALCAFARFCDPNGQVWNQVAHTEKAKIRTTLTRQVGDCPSGRLVAWDKSTGQAIEPKLPVSIVSWRTPSSNAAVRSGFAEESR